MACTAWPACNPPGPRNRRRLQPVRAEGTNSSGDAVEQAEEGPPVANPLFNSQFASVLQTALKRSGPETLLGGPLADPNKREQSAQEEVLHSALQASRRNVRMLTEMLEDVEGALGREKQQFERLHFALKKARADAAYLASTEKMLERARAETRQLQQQQAEEQ